MTHIIGIKELHRNLKNISQEVQKGSVFIVVKHGKPVFEINPYQEKIEKKYQLADFMKLRFSSSEGNLSKIVDKIVYS